MQKVNLLLVFLVGPIWARERFHKFKDDGADPSETAAATLVDALHEPLLECWPNETKFYYNRAIDKTGKTIAAILGTFSNHWAQSGQPQKSFCNTTREAWNFCEFCVSPTTLTAKETKDLVMLIVNLWVLDESNEKFEIYPHLNVINEIPQIQQPPVVNCDRHLGEKAVNLVTLVTRLGGIFMHILEAHSSEGLCRKDSIESVCCIGQRLNFYKLITLTAKIALDWASGWVIWK
ncbi:unnamed protein product, partial [Mesorhabditis belari]|uniref:Uncharacterized protein n=1 Tax=Mesorhabditis belari TaxID=2138241 RepID=A0AAF3EZS2_9BILA